MDAEVKPQIEDLLGISCFMHLEEEQQQYILTNASILSIDKGEILFEQGGMKNHMFCLLHGRVKIGLTASSGNERIVDILLPGQTFGESAFFWKKEVPVYAQAMMNSRVLLLDTSVILEGIRKWPEMSLLFLEMAHLRIQSLLEGMYACCLRNAQQRLNDYLIKHAEPLEKDPMQAVVNLKASKSVVASSLNLSPETFSRQLHKLEDDGVLKIDRQTLHIHDLNELRNRCLM